jgi:hypothetical protein
MIIIRILVGWLHNLAARWWRATVARWWRATVARWWRATVARWWKTHGWRRVRRIYIRDRAVIEARAMLRRTATNKRIKVSARHHLHGADDSQLPPLTIHDVWLERDSRRWWQSRWCWWLGCAPRAQRHGYCSTRRGANRVLRRALAGHRCPAVTR